MRSQAWACLLGSGVAPTVLDAQKSEPARELPPKGDSPLSNSGKVSSSSLDLGEKTYTLIGFRKVRVQAVLGLERLQGHHAKLEPSEHTGRALSFSAGLRAQGHPIAWSQTCHGLHKLAPGPQWSVVVEPPAEEMIRAAGGEVAGSQALRRPST